MKARLRSALADDRGAASAELVIALALVMLVVMAAAQFALWSHATHIAQAAASQGLAASRVQDGTADDGRRAAQYLLDQLASGPLSDESISSKRGDVSASVRVFGTATAVVPFVRLPVHAEAAGPVERFLPDGAP
ncbi:TadE family protein [Lentzea sp. JNUCC 0626]|uniref:TadE family protein n=1 Tax=Lentzea sp. JNUCC 0626 TaxID=3367513 RepID=UPI00374A1B52